MEEMNEYDSGLIEKIEYKYGEGVYTNGRPRVGPVRFDFQDKENKEENGMKNEMKIEKENLNGNKKGKGEKMMEKTANAAFPAAKKRQSMAPSMETIEESYLEYLPSPKSAVVPSKAIAKPKVEKKQGRPLASVIKSEPLESNEMFGIGFASKRQLMRTPPRGIAAESTTWQSPVAMSNSPMIVDAIPVIPSHSSAFKLKNKIRVIDDDEEDMEVKVVAPKTRLVRNSVANVNKNDHPTPQNKSRFEAPTEEVDDLPPAPLKDEASDKWLSKATRARLASKAARALETLIRSTDDDYVDDTDVGSEKKKKLIKKLKTPKSMRKKKSKAIEIDVQPPVANPVAPVLAVYPPAQMPFYPVQSGYPFGVPVVMPVHQNPPMTSDSAKWLTLASQLPIPSQMVLHGAYHQLINAKGADHAECERQMMNMMQSYFPHLFNLGVMAPSAVPIAPKSPAAPECHKEVDSAVQQEVKVEAVTKEKVNDPQPLVVDDLCEKISSLVIEPTAVLAHEEMKQVVFESPAKREKEETPAPVTLHFTPPKLLAEVPRQLVTSAKKKSPTMVIDNSIHGRVTRLAATKQKKVREQMLSIETEIEKMQSSKAPLHEENRKLAMELVKLDQDLLLFTAAMEDLEHKGSKSTFQEKLNQLLASKATVASEQELDAIRVQLIQQYGELKTVLDKSKQKLTGALQAIDERFAEMKVKMNIETDHRLAEFDRLRNYTSKLDAASYLLSSKTKSPARSPARIVHDDTKTGETKQSLRRVQAFLDKRKSLGAS